MTTMASNRITDRPYEAAAARRTVEGWVCVHCKRYHGKYEHEARVCCCTSRPCYTEGCTERASRSLLYCDGCLDSRTRDRYQNCPERPWDGKFPLTLLDDNFWAFDKDEIYDFLDDHPANQLGDFYWMEGVPSRPPSFDLADYFQDYLADPEPPGDWEAAENSVNAWLADNDPISYVLGPHRVPAKSIARYLDPEKGGQVI